MLHITTRATTNFQSSKVVIILLRQSPQTLVHSDQRNTCDGVQQRYVAKEYFLDATQGTDVSSI